jgi:hypothetical protein
MVSDTVLGRVLRWWHVLKQCSTRTVVCHHSDIADMDTWPIRDVLGDLGGQCESRGLPCWWWTASTICKSTISGWLARPNLSHKLARMDSCSSHASCWYGQPIMQTWGNRPRISYSLQLLFWWCRWGFCYWTLLGHSHVDSNWLNWANVMLYWEQKVINSVERKTLALSVVILLGIPNCMIMFSSKNLIVAVLEKVFKDTTSTHPVK